MTCTALRARQAERAGTQRATAVGLTPDQYRAALLTACICWTGRAPWRFLPEYFRGHAFVLFGRRYTGRLLMAWKEEGGG